MQPKYFRKKDTGEIYAHTDILAKRKDMEPYEGPLPGAAGSKPKENDPSGSTEDPNRVALIVDAIKMLEDEDFTGAGKPKIDALNEKLGFTITSEERDKAYEIWSKGE